MLVAYKTNYQIITRPIEAINFSLCQALFIMRKIIEQLKEQREKAKDTFIKNSFIKRNCQPDSPCPDTDSYLNDIGELNKAISILENDESCKTVNA